MSYTKVYSKGMIVWEIDSGRGSPTVTINPDHIVAMFQSPDDPEDLRVLLSDGTKLEVMQSSRKVVSVEWPAPIESKTVRKHE